MAHMAIVGCAESDDSETLKASEECGTQNSTKPSEETSIEENLDGRPREEYLAEIGVVAVGNFLSNITTNSEDQFLDHLDECLERSSCNDGVSSCSVSLPRISSAPKKEAFKQHQRLTIHPWKKMIIDMSGSDTKSDPFILSKKTKVEDII